VGTNGGTVGRRNQDSWREQTNACAIPEPECDPRIESELAIYRQESLADPIV